MALLTGEMCGMRNDSCSHKHKYARTSHGMASESLSRGVDPFFAQEFCFIKQEHGPPRGSKQAKTDVLLTTVVGPLCGGLTGISSSNNGRVRVSSPQLGRCPAQSRVVVNRGSGDVTGQMRPTLRAEGRNSQGLLGLSALRLQLAWCKGPRIDDHSKASVHCGHIVLFADELGGPPLEGHTYQPFVRVRRNFACHTHHRAFGSGRRATPSDTAIFGIFRKRAGLRTAAVRPAGAASSETRC